MSRSLNSEEPRKKKKIRWIDRVSVKMSVALGLMVLALFLLLLKIYKIQNDNADQYNKIVLTQRQSEYVSQTIPARRGDIYDRNGNRLATSEKVYILILDPKQMLGAEGKKADGTKTKNVVDPTLAAVSSCFGLDYAQLLRMVEDNPSSSYIRAEKDISYDAKQAFLSYQEEKNAEYAASSDPETKKKKITGVWFEDNYKRKYPYGSLACSVLGFASSDGISGNGGVEQYYNDILTGVAGREYGYLNDDADLEKVIKSAQNGNTLVLTIDEGIQQTVEKYLKEWGEGEIGSKSAACIVMNPKNGEVLAMASTNSFDLNSPVTTGNYSEEEIYEFGLEEAVIDYKKNHPEELSILKERVPEYYSREEILELGKINASYRIWRNICVSDTYEPGSTQKIFTVAGAMEEGIISSTDTFNCEGHISLSDGINTWRINCVNRNGHGILDVTGGITNSCNVVMMNIAFLEKSETFMKYERIFGFGEYTGIDLPAEADTENLGFATDSIGRTQLATNSFGQNYNCTMIQMAAAYASVANGGYYYEPHVVKQILSSDGSLLEEKSPKLVRETVSKSTCDYLKYALFETVNTGTGKAAAVSGYSVGGKTGTAQKLPRSAETYVVSFCGFAPVEDPQLLCYVIVDEPALPGQEAAHSSFASNIFSKIMAEALPAVGCYPEGVSAAEYMEPVVRETQPATESGKEEEGAEGGTSEKQTQPKEKTTRAAEELQTDAPEETDAIEETAPTEAVTDEFIQGDDDDGEIPEIIFGVAPGE